MTNSARQKTLTQFEMDFGVPLEILDSFSRDTKELGLMSAEKTHLFLHEVMMVEDSAIADEHWEYFEYFDPDTLQIVHKKVKVDDEGCVQLARDFEEIGLEKGDYCGKWQSHKESLELEK